MYFIFKYEDKSLAFENFAEVTLSYLTVFHRLGLLKVPVVVLYAFKAADPGAETGYTIPYGQ